MSVSDSESDASMAVREGGGDASFRFMMGERIPSFACRAQGWGTWHNGRLNEFAILILSSFKFEGLKVQMAKGEALLGDVHMQGGPLLPSSQSQSAGGILRVKSQRRGSLSNGGLISVHSPRHVIGKPIPAPSNSFEAEKRVSPAAMVAKQPPNSLLL